MPPELNWLELNPLRPGRLRLAGCHRRHAPLSGRDTRWDGRIGLGVRLRDRLDGRGCGVGWRDARGNGRVGLFCVHGSSLHLPGSTRSHSSEAAPANIRAASLNAQKDALQDEDGTPLWRNQRDPGRAAILFGFLGNDRHRQLTQTIQPVASARIDDEQRLRIVRRQLGGKRGAPA